MQLTSCRRGIMACSEAASGPGTVRVADLRLRLKFNCCHSLSSSSEPCHSESDGRARGVTGSRSLGLRLIMMELEIRCGQCIQTPQDTSTSRVTTATAARRARLTCLLRYSPCDPSADESVPHGRAGGHVLRVWSNSRTVRTALPVSYVTSRLATSTVPAAARGHGQPGEP
eukprot:420723-Rhodomonas_salina.1